MFQTCLNESNFDLSEGFLCIDFLNTMGWRESDAPQESLGSYEHLAEWARQKSLLTTDETRALIKKSNQNKSAAKDALSHAIAFRALLDDIFATTSEGHMPAARAIKQFNKMLRDALGHLELVADEHAFRIEVLCKTDLLSPIIWPIAISAAQILSSEELERIGVCRDDDGCGYFFYDTSKNHTKKYCGSGCATRAKVRRFREKQK